MKHLLLISALTLLVNTAIAGGENCPHKKNSLSNALGAQTNPPVVAVQDITPASSTSTTTKGTQSN